MELGRLLFFSIALMGLAACGGSSVKESATQEQSPPPVESSDDKWTDLLSAGTLDDWEMYSQDEVEDWELVDGELRASGAGWDAEKDLITKAKTTPTSSWSWNGRSHPVTVRVSSTWYRKDGVHQIYELAPEYQVMDDAGWDSPLEPNQLTAGNYAMHAPEGAGPEPVGEWNTTRIVVRQPRVEHWLNGTKVVDYELGSEDWKARKAAGKWAEVDDYALATSGRIGLQNAGEVTYRNIRIREL